MIKWYLISYVDNNNKMVIDFYALKKKEILQYIRNYRVIAISKISKRQALEFDRNWTLRNTKINNTFKEILIYETNKE